MLSFSIDISLDYFSFEQWWIKEHVKTGHNLNQGHRFSSHIANGWCHSLNSPCWIQASWVPFHRFSHIKWNLTKVSLVIKIHAIRLLQIIVHAMTYGIFNHYQVDMIGIKSNNKFLLNLNWKSKSASKMGLLVVCWEGKPGLPPPYE